MSYALKVSDDERERYRLMAASAVAHEVAEWRTAGIAPGARVADIGCGPGAVTRLLAEAVGSAGYVVGLDADPEALAMAAEELDGLPQAATRQGRASNTGLAPEAFDVVMCRHVLTHNGTTQQSIVDHLAGLAVPGGTVYLVEADLPGNVQFPEPEPALAALGALYRRYQVARGNDLRTGGRLGGLLDAAGLDVETFRVVSPPFRLPAGLRGPEWAARDSLVAAGLAAPEEVARWAAAFDRLDSQSYRPWVVLPMYVAIGRKPVR
jgi:SAM-dependent methyltransferase